MLIFFFFKQKTAYEMRISDWSSDVCSSELFPGQRLRPLRHDRQCLGMDAGLVVAAQGEREARKTILLRRPESERRPSPAKSRPGPARHPHRPRSEEHTSELQSLMRISYAVLCLQKKK